MPRRRSDDMALWGAALALGVFLLAFPWYVMIR